MHASTISESTLAAYVAAFCTAPKTGVLEATAFDAWVLYTGDGFKLPDFLCEQLRKLQDSGRSLPAIFITGCDNLMLASGGKDTKASTFADHLSSWTGLPRDEILVDDEASNTHGQAISLIRECKTRGWKRVALFIGGHHAVRALLTTIARLNMAIADAGPGEEREKLEELLVMPIPCHDLQFLHENIALVPPPERSGSSAWDWTEDGLAKAANYQHRTDPGSNMPWCASWKCAYDYINWVITQLKQ